MSIPRKIYINQHKEEQNNSFLLCKKKLPRGKKRHYLYECEISEQQFKEYHDFDFFLTNPEIEGVYETQIPLKYSFITTVGSITKIDSKEIHNRRLNKGKIVFEQKDFRPMFTYFKPYLVNYKINYIYVAQLSYKDNQIWAYLNVLSNDFHFYLVQKRKDKTSYVQVIRDEL